MSSSAIRAGTPIEVAKPTSPQTGAVSSNLSEYVTAPADTQYDPSTISTDHVALSSFRADRVRTFDSFSTTSNVEQTMLNNLSKHISSDSVELEQLNDRKIEKIRKSVLEAEKAAGHGSSSHKPKCFQRFCGVIKTWSFITPESPSRDLFVHSSNVQGDAGLWNANK